MGSAGRRGTSATSRAVALRGSTGSIRPAPGRSRRRARAESERRAGGRLRPVSMRKGWRSTTQAGARPPRGSCRWLRGGAGVPWPGGVRAGSGSVLGRSLGPRPGQPS
jgi:hypothetical protein